MPYGSDKKTLKVYRAYDLPSVAALIRYLDAAAGYPVRSTWLKAIGSGNYSTWMGLTLANAKSIVQMPRHPSWATLYKKDKGSGPPR